MVEQIVQVTGETSEGGKPLRKRVAAATNYLMHRLDLGSLLITGHEQYPDSLSRVTPMQAAVFSLYDALREKTVAWGKLKRADMAEPHKASRYYACKDRIRAHGLREACVYYGTHIFTGRYESRSQSLDGEGRREFLSAIEEKATPLRYMSREDLEPHKETLKEKILGPDKQRR